MIDNTVDYTPATVKGSSNIIGGTAEISKLSIKAFIKNTWILYTFKT